MKKNNPVELSNRLKEIIKILDQTYPDAHCELNYSNPLELLVATILSARCTDKQVNKVTANLFQKYHTAAEYAGMDAEELESDLKTLGMFRNKAKSIQKCCQALVDEHNGQVPNNMDALVTLAGVGRKTANVVLGNAFHINEGVVVDTHVIRLSGLLALTPHTDPEKIEADLMQLVPREKWTLFSHWLIWHGRRRCPANRPDCSNCEIQNLCPGRA